jgi:hypothetical protein
MVSTVFCERCVECGGIGVMWQATDDVEISPNLFSGEGSCDHALQNIELESNSNMRQVVALNRRQSLLT